MKQFLKNAIFVVLGLLLAVTPYQYVDAQNSSTTGVSVQKNNNAFRAFDLLNFAVHYNTSTATYLTTTIYSDAATLNAGSNVLRVVTADADDEIFLTAAMYKYAEDPADDRLMYRDANGLIQVWDNAWNSIATITPEVSFTFEQGNCYDPVNERIYTYKTDGTVTVFDLSGNEIEQLTAPVVGPGIHWYYDYKNLQFYVAVQGQTVPVQVWKRSGGSLVLYESLWWSSRGGATRDYVLNGFTSLDGTGVNYRFRQNAVNGREGIHMGVIPFTDGLIGEGLAVAPDGTIYIADVAGHDSDVPGGNRIWHFDPWGVSGQYDRAPSMTRFSRFSGGTMTGQFDTQEIRQYVGQRIFSPVYDTQGYTNTENTSAWTFRFSAGGDADIVWVGSNTAPTGSSQTNYFSTLPQYSGWGATTPSAEQGTPGTFRYKQAILTVKPAASNPLITVQDLIDQIQPQILCIEHDSEMMYFYTDPTTGSAKQIPLLINQAQPENSWVNTTTSTRFLKETDYVSDPTNGALANLQTPSAIFSDQQGQLVVYQKKVAAGTSNVILGVGTSGSQANRVLITHNGSAVAPNNGLTITRTDAGAAVANRVSVANTNTTNFDRLDFISTGSAYQIWVNEVNQTLTVNTGSDNGDWFGDAGAPNLVARGFVAGINGQSQSKFFLYKNQLLTAAQNALITSWAAQEGYYRYTERMDLLTPDQTTNIFFQMGINDQEHLSWREMLHWYQK